MNGSNAAVLEALADMLQDKMQVKHDLPTGFSVTTNWMHGPTGIFGTPGLEQAVFSTHVKAMGLLDKLAFVPTNYTHPITQLLTGFTDEDGTEADGVCDDCVTAGEIKGCRQGTVFGRICRETDVLEVNKIGRMTNRSELTDLILVNSPLLEGGLMSMPPSIDPSMQRAINNEVLARWVTLGVSFQRKLCRLLWTGNVNNGNGGGYEEYDGLERLVKTGHTDVISGVSCPSLDSDVKDANYLSVNDNALTIYRLMQEIWRYVNFNADMMGFAPVEWAWVMNDSLFRMLTDYWPCVYATGRCYATNNDLSNTVNALEMRRMSDEMYTGNFLWIDGMRVPVIRDNCLPYNYNGDGEDADHGLDPGEFSSDIYLLPFTVRGGAQRVMFMEYFDYRTAMSQIQMARLGDEFWTDNGAWLWTFSRTNWCVNWKAKIEPRLRLKTPHLAGRLQNVKWVPIQKTRDTLPDDPYFTDGGFRYLSNAPYTIRSQ